MKLLEKFKRHDKSGDGTLNSAELHSLVKSLMPGATDNQLKYFQAMLDCGGENTRMGPDEFLKAASDCLAMQVVGERVSGWVLLLLLLWLLLLQYWHS